jgi:hypothetical protein
MLLEPFKFTAQSRMVVGYLEKNSAWRIQICQRSFIYYIQLLTTAL